MADWDLTSMMAPYLDRHLVFALFEFLETRTKVRSVVAVWCTSG
jgi:hypothetical protein